MIEAILAFMGGYALGSIPFAFVVNLSDEIFQQNVIAFLPEQNAVGG